MEHLFAILVIGGPILLAAVIIIGLVTSRRRTDRERARTEDATRTLYDQGTVDEINRS